MENKIIGYYAIIPTYVNKSGRKKAFWWTDLIISKEYQGNGYQNIIDNYITKRPEIKLGFPNKNASIIHKNHGWDIREDLKVMMFVIKPDSSSLFKNGRTIWSSILTLIMKPILIHKIKFKPKWSYKSQKINIQELTNIYYLNRGYRLTTVRDEKYFFDRYIQSPFYENYNYYLCNKSNNIKLYLITRKIKTNRGIILRIVDLFGATGDRLALKDLINLVISDSIIDNVSQITILESNFRLQQLLFSCGFIIFNKARFCSYGGISGKIRKDDMVHWVLADSDNDFLD